MHIILRILPYCIINRIIGICFQQLTFLNDWDVSMYPIIVDITNFYVITIRWIMRRYLYTIVYTEYSNLYYCSIIMELVLSDHFPFSFGFLWFLWFFISLEYTNLLCLKFLLSFCVFFAILFGYYCIKSLNSPFISVFYIPG